MKRQFLIKPQISFFLDNFFNRENEKMESERDGEKYKERDREKERI